MRALALHGVTCAKKFKRKCTRPHFEGVGRETGNRPFFSCGLIQCVCGKGSKTSEVSSQLQKFCSGSARALTPLYCSVEYTSRLKVVHGAVLYSIVQSCSRTLAYTMYSRAT